MKFLATAKNTACAPPEVLEALKRSPLSQKCAQWRAVPALPGDLRRWDEIEIDTKLAGLLEDPRLKQTLRSIDLLNGCCNQCETCLADAPRPSRLISLESIRRLFFNARFLTMLQPDSLRFGSCGDLLDHPQALEILEAAIEATKPLEQRLLAGEGRHHMLKVFTNYRPSKESLLDALLALADKNRERLIVVVSLPLNRSDSINRAFIPYALARPRFFRLKEQRYFDGYPEIEGAIKFGEVKVQIWDVRHAAWLLMVGRMLDRRYLRYQIDPGRCQSRFRALEAEQRGFCKTYLNADGLWLMIYGTAYESHTSRIYALLSPANLGDLGKIPYHPDFASAPNWPGGIGRRRTLSEDELRLKEAEYRAAGGLKKRRSVIHLVEEAESEAA
jgi:hypothetical protein